MMNALVTWGKAVTLGRKIAVGIAALVFVGAVAALIWWFVATSSASAEPDTAASAGDGPRAAAALEALETNPESLLPEELAGTVDFDEAIPPGAKVEADPDSWEPSTAGGGVITMTLTFEDGSTADVAAVMVEEEDGWKVLQTIPLEEGQ